MPSLPCQTLSRPDALASVPALQDSGTPFLSRAFLAALEASGAVGPGTGWGASHLLLGDAASPLALLPCYRKLDSRGEYVFDQAWAGAYQRHGLAYYPKLVSAIPFTPVPGPRLLLAPGVTATDLLPDVFEAIRQACARDGLSGWHGLFVTPDWLAPAAAAGFACRTGCRFHWSNAGYRDFDDFLEALTSKKRKDLRRERRRLREQGVSCRVMEGGDIDAATWRFFYACYERTYHEHGQHPYLPPAFFQTVAQTMPGNISLVMAEDAAGPMASALFFHDAQTLYGRYWGSLRRADGLHFEVCYYQGMELCLRRGLRDFDPGTQGEHKLLRGFAPVLTYSLHWLEDARFQAAIKRFVEEERQDVERYVSAAAAVLPFRQAPGEA